jgi:hypothetical protein
MVDSVKELEIGDTVSAIEDPTLLMVVTSINAHTVTCTWNNEEGHSQSQKFKPEELEKEKFLRPGNIF